MKAQQLMEVLQSVVGADLASPQSILDFYMSNPVAGGWEGWLQTVYARGVFAKDNSIQNFDREVTYPPPSHLKCDLCFYPIRGTNIYVELKTQRQGGYAGTVGDFSADILKIMSFGSDFRNTKVIVAFAVFKLAPNDRVPLDQLRTGVRGGMMRYWSFVGNRWNDVTDNILHENNPNYMIAGFTAN